MVNIGIVGIGFMGMTHYRGSHKVKGGKVAAICTRDPRKLKGDWRGIRGNFGAPGGREDLSGITPYDDIDDLLADPKIDLVDICLPSAQHKNVAIRAMRAGKQVLLEKPIALNMRDADQMVKESKKAGQLLMVAQVLPFVPQFAFLRKVVEEKTYGNLLGAHFKRIISRPDWHSEYANMERSGGPGVDLHVHDTHFILLLCGVPDQVVASGRLVQKKYAEYLATTYRYKNKPDLAITCASGAISMSGRAFTHGFEVYLEKATLLFEFATLGGKPELLMPLTVLTADGKVKHPKLSTGDPEVAFTQELQAAVNAVSGKAKVIPELSGELAADALRLCFKEVESVKRGRAVRVK